MKEHPLKRLSETYLNEQDLSKTTLKTYRICYKYYLIYLKEQNIKYAKTSDVIKFREGLRKKDIPPIISTPICLHLKVSLSLFKRKPKKNKFRIDLCL